MQKHSSVQAWLPCDSARFLRCGRWRRADPELAGSDYSDFEKGKLKNLSLRSDGLLTLAPQFQEMFDSSSAYLWALARDSAGNLYAGGGPGAKLYRISPAGEKKTLAEFEALEIHAIAIDRKDRVYAATSPDGKVYRVSPTGKSRSLLRSQDEVHLGAGVRQQGRPVRRDRRSGRDHRVTPDGKGSVFFRSEETHARSLAVDAQRQPHRRHRTRRPGDSRLAGGRRLRAVPDGEEGSHRGGRRQGRIDLRRRRGTKQPGVVRRLRAPPVNPPAPAAPRRRAHRRPARAHVLPPATSVGASSAVTGGSEVYRIDPDGRPEKSGRHAQDIVYALAFDAQGTLLSAPATRVHLPHGYEHAPHGAAQRPAHADHRLLLRADGMLYAATGNVGKVYEIGPGLEHEGSIESDVFDAGLFRLWGRLSFTAELQRRIVAVSTRAGNLDRPAQNWSPGRTRSHRPTARASLRLRRASCNGRRRSTRTAAHRRSWNRSKSPICRRTWRRELRRSRSRRPITSSPRRRFLPVRLRRSPCQPLAKAATPRLSSSGLVLRRLP